MTAILALGGGGFTCKPGDPSLDRLALEVTGKREPKILFVPTAGGDASEHIAAFHATFGEGPGRPEHLSLFHRGGSSRSVREIVLDQDVIYVGGGSLRNMLAIWRAHGLDDVLVEAYKRGIAMAGLSAGAMCWFAAGVTKSGGPPEPIRGLGILADSMSVHADGEPERLPVWLECVRRGELPGGWAVDDGAGLVFEDGRLQEVVSARPGAGALRVDAVGGELVRSRIPGRLLDARGHDGDPGVSAKITDAIRELRAVRELRGQQRRDQ